MYDHHYGETAEFNERVRVNRQTLAANLKTTYDSVVCGSGSSTVVARRLAQIQDATVFLLEAVVSDDVQAVIEAAAWPANLGTERRRYDGGLSLKGADLLLRRFHDTVCSAGLL